MKIIGRTVHSIIIISSSSSTSRSSSSSLRASVCFGLVSVRWLITPVVVVVFFWGGGNYTCHNCLEKLALSYFT